ncbi:Tagatose-6-phosphate kinase [compost metagenome]
MARILSLTLNPALDLTVRLRHLELGEVNRSEAVLCQAAGKGLNVAQVLADLGHSLTVSGFLGADNLAPFETLFRHRDFIDQFIRVPGETRSNIKLAERSGRITDLNGPGPEVDSEAQEQLLACVERIAEGHDLAIIAGSLPRGVEPAFLRELLSRLKRLGLRVALDSSGAALSEGLQALPWLIKPNGAELAEIRGRERLSATELGDVARELCGRGIEHVVVSHGADGVSWFSHALALWATPPTVEVASTVGAGDSLLAAMVHGLLSGWPAERVLRHATAVGALAVTQFDFGIQDPERLEQLEQQVAVRRMS